MRQRRRARSFVRAVMMAPVVVLLAGCVAVPVEDSADAPAPMPQATIQAPEAAPAPSPAPGDGPPVLITPPTPPGATPPTPPGATPPNTTPQIPQPRPNPRQPSEPPRDAGRPAPGPTGAPVPAPEPQDSSTHHDSVEVTSEVGNLGFSHNGGQSGDDFVLNLWSYDPDDDLLTFDVTGTHNDQSTPASWFNQQTNGHVVHTDVDTDDQPSELHYAWCGTLTFNDFESASTPTCFGQGESGLENNWWMGGSGYDDQRDGCFIDSAVTDANANALVACLSTPGTSSYRFEVNTGGANPNYLSLYSPDESMSFDPRTVGENVENYILANDSGLSASDKAVLRALVAALPDDTYETPTLWSFECEDACADEGEHSVTSGQLFAGVHDTTAHEGVLWTQALEGTNVNNYSINATAGRNKSDDVAEWFDNAVGPDGGMMGAGASESATSPNQLHFAFCGDLVSSGGTGSASIPTCFGQGENSDDGEANNWWAGGSDWHLMDSTDPEMLAAFAPIDDLGPLGGTEVNILINPRYGTALVALTGNVLTGVAVDGVMFVVGIG